MNRLSRRAPPATRTGSRNCFPHPQYGPRRVEAATSTAPGAATNTPFLICARIPVNPLHQVEVSLLAQPSLGADIEVVADNQHADYQLGVDGWPACLTVEAPQPLAEAVKVYEASVERSR
jgi:hypothetical protein